LERTWRLDQTIEGVSVHGEIDLGSAAECGERLYEAVADLDGPLVIDLCGVTFMDSSGVHALTRLADVMTGFGHHHPGIATGLHDPRHSRLHERWLGRRRRPSTARERWRVEQR
jgi:STAS domain